MEFDERPDYEGTDKLFSDAEIDPETGTPNWEILSQLNNGHLDGDPALIEDVEGEEFGVQEDAPRLNETLSDDAEDDLLDPVGVEDPQIDVVSAWRAVHEMDRVVHGHEAEETAESHVRLAEAEWELLQKMAPVIDDTGELAALAAELEDSDNSGDKLDDDAGDEEAEATEQMDGNTALLEPNEVEEADPELNTSGEVADHLIRLVRDYDKDQRGLPNNAGKRLRETPEVPQEEIHGLLGMLFNTSLPTEAWSTGWEDLEVSFGDNEELRMHIYTYQQEVEKVTPQATRRIDIPKESGKFGGLFGAVLGKLSDYVEGEFDVPEEAYFETSNLLCHHDGENQMINTAMADPNGIRSPGPSEYDHGILRSIGVKDYVNSDKRFQYIVRAEIGIDHHEEEIHTRYVVYESAKNGGGYLIARSDNDFATGRRVRATTYIPAAEEVNKLRDLIWVMLNSSAS
jgi:hypothetical protein